MDTILSEPITEVRISNLQQLQDPAVAAQVNSCKGVVKFTIAKEAVEPDEVADPFLWSQTDSFLEVYKLPRGQRWLTGYFDGTSVDPLFPEFLLCRMNTLHRYRVRETLNYLWSSGGCENIVWDGTSGTGKVRTRSPIPI